MRVCYVTHQYPPNYNTGTELYAKRLALKTRGVFGLDTRIFTYEPSYHRDAAFVRREETVDAGIPVTRVCMWSGLLPNYALGMYYNVFLGKSFGHYLEQTRPAVVHFFHTAFLGASLLEEAFLRDIPVVVNLMDFWFLCPTAQLLRTRTQTRCSGPSMFECTECLSLGNIDYERLLRFTEGEGFTVLPPEAAAAGDALHLHNPSVHSAFSALAVRLDLLRGVLSRAARIIAPSQTLKNVFVRAGYDARRIDVVRYGVDPMPPYSFDRSESPEFRIGFIGSINRPKGLHLLLEAMRGLEGEVTLDIFGNPSANPHYAEECFATARRDPRIRIRGAMAPEHVATALRAVDALVVPSLWHENTPFVVLEARAAGVPVVGSDVEGIAEIVRDGVNGRLFSAGDPVALRGVLQELVDDRGQVRRLTGHFADVKTLLANTREFVHMYEGLAGVRAGAGG